MLTARRTMALRGDAPPAPVEPAPSPALAEGFASRDARIAELEADNEALREKLALCETALGDVSEQLAAAQAPKARAPRSQG
jgi:hypothetical protein